MIATDDPFIRAEDVVSCELEGGSALLDLTSSSYFRLNETANFVWEILADGPKSADHIADRIVESYAVEKEVCLPDVITILTELKTAKLISERR